MDKPLASFGICAPPPPPSASQFLFHLPFAPLRGYCLFLFSLYLFFSQVVIPRGARKAHFRSRDIGDPALPHHLGHEELDLVVSLQSTTIDRADLDVVLVALPELHDAI